jgi:hypothetical protein
MANTRTSFEPSLSRKGGRPMVSAAGLPPSIEIIDLFGFVLPASQLYVVFDLLACGHPVKGFERKLRA